VCGLAADSDSVHKQTTDAHDETAESLIPKNFPTPSLSVHPANGQGQRCMQLLLDIFTLDWWIRMDWALPRLLPPKG